MESQALQWNHDLLQFDGKRRKQGTGQINLVT
jgi:hypothetical protein